MPRKKTSKRLATMAGKILNADELGVTLYWSKGKPRKIPAGVILALAASVLSQYESERKAKK